MTLFLDIFGRPAPIGVRETLKVLDCSDIAELNGGCKPSDLSAELGAGG